MQNIPSHAEDIRHMFRASSVKQMMLDCKTDEEDKNISVVLPNIYYVETQEGKKPVTELEIGSRIKLVHENEETWLPLKDMVVGTKETDYNATLTFEAV